MPVSLTELLSYVISDCSGKLKKKNLSIQHDIFPPNLAIVADYTHFRQAIHQLVDNAIRYSHDGATITIRAFERQDQVILAIKDEGIGISADEMPFIFNRFWRKDTAHTEAGLGLGLSLAQKIVELHGGKIEVESEHGKGSMFRIVLPI
jgi:signal transduction histidine kinase